MGRDAARRFAENGDKVFILGRRLDKLQEVAKSSSQIEAVQADVTALDSIKVACQQIISKTKQIDVLVNCAGGTAKLPENPTLEDEQATWNQIIDTNLTGVFNVIAVFDKHINDGGRVINITSLAAFSGSRQPGVTGQAYSAAKSGLHGMSRTLVGKFSERDITINCLAPGLIKDTGFFGGSQPPDALANYYLSRTPLGRVGLPDEIAAGIFYLASPDAGFITGEILNINGGVQFGR